jgi:Immunity protein 35
MVGLSALMIIFLILAQALLTSQSQGRDMKQADAIDIALKVLYQEIEIPQEDEIIVTEIEETDEGWLIQCNSRIFMETDDPMYALVTAPIFINRDGSHHFVF